MRVHLPQSRAQHKAEGRRRKEGEGGGGVEAGPGRQRPLCSAPQRLAGYSQARRHLLWACQLL